MDKNRCYYLKFLAAVSDEGGTSAEIAARAQCTPSGTLRVLEQMIGFGLVAWPVPPPSHLDDPRVEVIDHATSEPYTPDQLEDFARYWAARGSDGSGGAS